MALKLNSVRADLGSETAGAWKEVPYWKGTKFKVRALTTTEYLVKRDAAMQALSREFKDTVIPVDRNSVAIGQCLAEEILVGWEGIADDDGKLIPYSPEKALEVLSDPAFREVVNAVLFCANEVSRLEAKFVEDDAKN